MKTGGRIASRKPPRRHALSMPMAVPSANAMTVDIPTRPSVQGSPCLTTSPTDDGKKVTDVPKLPESVLPRYWKYCWKIGWWLFSPSATSSVWMV